MSLKDWHRRKQEGPINKAASNLDHALASPYTAALLPSPYGAMLANDRFNFFKMPRCIYFSYSQFCLICAIFLTFQIS